MKQNAYRYMLSSTPYKQMQFLWRHAISLLKQHTDKGWENKQEINLSTEIYRGTSNIRRTFADNRIIDHSDVVGAAPVGAASTTSSFSTLTPGFNGLSRDNGKTRRESFKTLDLERYILENWRYIPSRIEVDDFPSDRNTPRRNW